MELPVREFPFLTETLFVRPLYQDDFGLFLSSFKQALCSQVEAQLKEASDKTWPAIQKLLDSKTQTVVSAFSSALSSFEIDEKENRDMILELKNYGRGLVEGMAKKEAGRVAQLMKERFEFIFCKENGSTPRDWTTNHDIPAIAETARSSSLKLLSVLAAIRLDGDAGDIWNTLKKGTTTSPHLLVPSTWEKVPAAKTLLTPSECKLLWDQFNKDINYIITQAIGIQIGNKKNKKSQMWKSTLDAARTVAGPKSVVSTICVVGAVSIAVVTTSGNVVVVAAVGAGAAGAVVGVVFAGAMVGFAAHNAMAYVKNSIWGMPRTLEDK